jgi:cobalt-zinc-cadmium efflux system outer membrane protein
VEPQQLSLPQVVEVSLQNNGDLKSFREEKGIRVAGKIRAGLLPNPTLDLEGGTGALTGSKAENNLAIGVSQEFLVADKRVKRLAIADRELEAFQWQLADRERTVREEVKTVFNDAVLAEQRLKLTDRSIELHRQLLEITKERLAAGDIPELEMNLAKVELARSEGGRIEVERALLQTKSRLFTFMGLPAGAAPAIAGTLESLFSLDRNLADLKRRALEQRPDLKALAAEARRGDAEVALASTERFPNLTAGLALRRDTTSMEIGGVEGKDTAYTIAFKLSMPIPLFDRNQAGVQEARAKQGSTEFRMAAVTRSVEREVETAYSSVLNAEQVLSLYKSNIIPQIEENLKLTQEAYRLGEVGILAVIQEQKKFFEVSDGYLMALHARLQALVKLESAVATDINGGVQ